MTAHRGWDYNTAVSTDAPPSADAAQAESQPRASGTESLAFDKAAYAEPVATRSCAACKQSIADAYYEVRGQTVCRTCRDQLVGATPDRWAFLRALLYGGLVGAAGTLVWSLIIHFTGYELGLIAIVVGIGVGIAVRRGSHGRGGWKYQTLAMVLTYVSITTSYVPIIVKGFAQGGRETATATAVQNQPSSTTAPSPDNHDNPQVRLEATPVSTGSEAATNRMPAAVALLAFFVIVWGLALAAPFLAGTSNIMGIIIIAIGLYEAWKFNRRLVVTGPYELAPASAALPTGTTPPGARPSRPRANLAATLAPRVVPSSPPCSGPARHATPWSTRPSFARLPARPRKPNGRAIPPRPSISGSRCSSCSLLALFNTRGSDRCLPTGAPACNRLGSRRRHRRVHRRGDSGRSPDGWWAWVPSGCFF